jgi:hypothetical protein
MRVDLIKPFGPTIMKAILPSRILNQINEYVENFDGGADQFPNMLLRDINNIFLEKNFCDEIGFTKFVEYLGNGYLDNVGNPKNYKSVVLASMDGNTNPDFAHTEGIFADAWVNRYYSGDYTPIHCHGSILSGVIFLKIHPDLIKEQNNVEISRQLGSLPTRSRLNGKVEFIYGSGCDYSDPTWYPDQKVASVILFPSWLSHQTYIFKNDKERRTLSFNLSPT